MGRPVWPDVDAIGFLSMAIHRQLPIYKAAFDLLSVAVDYVVNMPRSFKAAIGGRVSGLCVEIVLQILRANSARDKVPHIETLLERVAELELLLRLCVEKRFISRPQYAKAVELTTSVGKQANGWRRHYAASPVT
jgi:hypothetical protein